MEVFDFASLLESKQKQKVKSTIAIGVFDGVHLGHQEIFRRLAALRDSLSADEAIVISFSRNPKARATGCLDTLRLRGEYIESFSINSFVIIDFSDEFSKISARSFVSMLTELTDVRGVVVGEDFRFGSLDAAASATDLASLFSAEGKEVQVDIVNPILTEGGEKISSTLLRTIIRLGKLGEFSKLSGQHYRVDLVGIPNRLASGDLVLSKASIHQLLPPIGAYDARVTCFNGLEVKGKVEVRDDSLRFFKPKGEPLQIEVEQLDSLYFGEEK